MPGSLQVPALAQSPIPSALLGELVVFGLFAMVAWALLREAARIVVRILLAAAIAVGFAVWAGWLDQTVAGDVFQWLGRYLMIGVRVVTQWLVQAWNGVSGAG